MDLGDKLAALDGYQRGDTQPSSLNNEPELTPPAPEDTPPAPQDAAPPVETPPVETSTNTPPVETPPAPENAPPAAWSMNLEEFNKTYETSFENEDAFKEALGAPKKVGELQGRIDELTQMETLYNSLKDRVGKTKEIFANESIQKLNELHKKFPDKDAAMISKVLDLDLNSINTIDSKLDALVLKEQLENGSDFDPKIIKSTLLSRFGVDPDDSPNDWSPQAQYMISKEYNSAQKEFLEMKNVELDPLVDFDTMKQEAEAKIEDQRNKWTELSGEIVKGFNGISIDLGDGDVFEFSADENFRNAVKESLVSRGLNKGEPSEEAVRDAAQWMKDQFIALNYDKMLKAQKKQIIESLKDQKHAEINNETPPNTNEAPPTTNTNPSFADQYKQRTQGRESNFIKGY